MSIRLLFLGLLLATLAGCARPRSVAPAYQRLELRGFLVDVNNAWRQAEPKLAQAALAALDADLENIARLVPPPALDRLRTRRIWIEPSTPAVGDVFSGRGMTFHPSREWLAEHDIAPEKAGCVDICNAEDYLAWREHQPLMVLHELAHAYHWLLDFNRPDVIAAFEAAHAAGLYEQVEYVLAPPGERRRAYALSNHKEYFAELSEAYFGRNDYFPFTRDELRDYDPMGYALIERLWNLDVTALEPEFDSASS